MEKTKLYYSNPDDKKLSRITRDLINNFLHSFNENFTKEDALNFFSLTRIPNERELYGLIIKSIFDMDTKDSVQHVATEVQIKRKYGNNNESTGRVDLLLHYRKTTFLIEFKVCRVSLTEKKSDDESIKSQKRATNAWINACNQLKELDTESLGSILKSERVVKIPIVIFLFQSGIKKQRTDIFNVIKEKHLEIREEIDEINAHEVFFNFISPLEKAIESHRRKSSSLVGGDKINFYGFSIMSTIIDR